MEILFEYKINNPDKDAMESKDEHRADRDDRNETDPDAVETLAEVDNAIDRKEIDHVKEGNMQDESIFVDMPVEENDADNQRGDAYEEVFPEVEALQIVGLTEEIPQEEKAEATYESVKGDIGRKMPIFIGAIEYDADDGKNEHNSLSIVNPIADVCDPVHEEESEQKPCDTIQLAGKTRVQLSEKCTDDGLHASTERYHSPLFYIVFY